MTSILSNRAAAIAQFNTQGAMKNIQDSIGRLSGGNRIMRAGDDVASLAVGTKFQSLVKSLMAALGNAGQATSMLGVADGALGAITEIIQRQQVLASQASSGALDENARIFLSQEFNGLSSEVDRLAGSTNFNNIKLVDGSLFKAGAETKTATKVDSSAASTSIKFGANNARHFALGLNSFTTSAGSTLVKINATNHGLKTGENVTFALTTATVDTITKANINGAKAITVIDANTFSFTAGGAAGAGGNFGLATQGDGFSVVANAARSYDLLDGNQLIVNGVTFTAKNNTAIANNFNLATDFEIATTQDQTPAQLATAVKAAIDRVVTNRATGYEKLVGITVAVDANDSSKLNFTSNAKGAVGNTISVSTAAGARLTGAGSLLSGPGTIKATGGTAGALTMMNTDYFGSVRDNILNSTAGARATASFTIATNPVNNSTGATIALGAIRPSDLGTSLIATQAGHGLVDGTVLNFAGAITLTNSGLTAGAGAYTVKVLNEDTYELTSAALTGAFTGDTTITSAGAAAYTVGGTDVGDRIVVNGKEFKYVSALTAGADNEILIGADIAATQINTIQTLNNSTDARVSEATYAAGATAGSITATYKAKGAAADYKFTLGGAGRSANLTITNSSLTGGTTTTGIDATRITNNSAFVGKIQGFQADYQSPSRVNLKIKVGEYIYQANNINTNVTGSDQWVTLENQDGGGSFKIQFKAANGEVVSDQSSTNEFVKRLDAAFSEISFTQRREISSFQSYGDIYTGVSQTGSLTGSAIFFNNDKFTNAKIESIKFTQPGTGQTDSRLEMVIDGESYQSPAGIGSTLAKGSLLRLTNLNNSSKYIEFRLGNTNLNLATEANAKAATTAYFNALGLNSTENSGVTFKVGTEDSDKIKIQIQGAKTLDIYRDADGLYTQLDISTAVGANKAIEVLNIALQNITSIRAQVGVFQSRFAFASAAINSSIQNQEAARSEFLDTKVDVESTILAREKVKANAGIAMLAQANQLSENLLQLLR